jgi:hypothetical protein
MSASQTNTDVEATRAADSAERASHAQRMHRRQMRRRTLFAGSIVVLLVLLTVFLAPFARQIKTIWMLNAAGFSVDWQLDRENWTSGGVSIVNFKRLWSVASFSGQTEPTQAHHEEVALLTSLLHVESLSLAEWDVMDESLAPLQTLGELRELNLSRLNQFRTHQTGPPGLDDRCVEPIRGLTRLKMLSLSGNRITDAGLARLTQLTALEYLDLDATDITDAGLVHLGPFRSLKSVNLAATKVTAEGIKKLQAAMPGVEISTEIDAELERGIRRWRESKR